VGIIATFPEYATFENIGLMIIDVNAAFGPWPFWEHSAPVATDLLALLSSNGIERAMVSHLGATFSMEVERINAQLYDACEPHPQLLPVPLVQPGHPGWEKALQKHLAREVKAVKIIPSYQQVTLSSVAFDALAAMLLKTDTPLLIALRLEDLRGQHRGLSFPDLTTDTIVEWHRRNPELKVVCLNASLPEIISVSRQTENSVGFDIAYAECGTTLDTLLQRVAPERLFFGSHSPLMYPKAATLKIRASQASPEQRLAVSSGNARKLFRL
jgi:predicted TIM-barrel fold metal-dependent hydrolase